MNPNNPSMGPGNNSQAVYAPREFRLAEAIVIEMTEIKNPMLF